MNIELQVESFVTISTGQNMRHNIKVNLMCRRYHSQNMQCHAQHWSESNKRYAIKFNNDSVQILIALFYPRGICSTIYRILKPNKDWKLHSTHTEKYFRNLINST